MWYNFDLSVWTVILLIIVFVALLCACVIGLAPMRVVARKMKTLKTPEYSDDESLPPLSVVVHAQNDEEHIGNFLRELMKQDYPEYEVIVVNDNSIDNTKEVVETVAAEEPRMKVTFVPDSAINVSRRKAAFTLGMKAASNDVVLLTSSNIDIPSPSWLRLMAAPFINKNIEICIGRSHIDPATDTNRYNTLRAFDDMLTLSQWIGYALSGKPYRGDRYNLALRRDIFFDNKGFASTNRFQTGEDDIFVNEIVTPSNAALVFYPESTPEVRIAGTQYPRLWLRSKERYDFTSRYLNTTAFRMQALHSALLWLALLSTAALVLIACPNLFPASVALLLWLLTWAYQICVYRRASAAMGTYGLKLLVPLYWLLRPLRSGYYRLKFRSTRSTNYTWRHDK